MTVESTDRRVRRTKKLFREALLALMAQKELPDITVTDIVEQADYNRTTFYRHYDYKEQLVNETITQQTGALIKTIKRSFEKKKYIDLQTLSPSGVYIFDHIYAHRSFYILWDKFIVLPGFKEEFHDSLMHFFKDEIVIVSQNTKVNDKLYTSFYAHGILGIIIDWIEDGLASPPDYMAKQLVEILNYYPGVSYIVDN